MIHILTACETFLLGSLPVFICLLRFISVLDSFRKTEGFSGDDNHITCLFLCAKKQTTKTNNDVVISEVTSWLLRAHPGPAC